MAGRIERWRASWSEESTTDLLAEWYHVPVLVSLMAFMLWTRLRTFDNFVRGGEVFFGGNDAYYHLREVSYVVAHWPRTMPFDPWTTFPYGTSADQFGTLYDQLVATGALVVGLGSPSEQTIALTLLAAPAVFGTLVALPVYYIGRHLGGRPSGLFAVFVLAVLPGAFFQRSIAGFSDHHVAEVLFQTTAVLATLVAVHVAEEERPVVEQFTERDWTGLRRTLVWSGLAGAAVGLYLWTWPPGVVLVGILGVFYLVALSAEVARGRSPEHLAIVGVLSLAVAFVMTLLAIDSWAGFGSSTSLNPLHLTLIAGVAAGCAFLAALSRRWEARDLPPGYYPVAVGALVVVGTVGVSVVLPDLYGSVRGSALSAFGFGQADTILTIREAQSVPLDQLVPYLTSDYGLLFIPALAGVLLLAWEAVRTDRHRAGWLLVVVWAVFTTMMAMTQVRFHYYLAVVVAVLNGWVFVQLVPLLDLPERVEGLGDIKGFQVMTVLAVVMFVVVPLAPPVAANNVVSVGDSYGPGNVVAWDEGLDWMESNTPPEGTYGDADEPMPYYGTYEPADDFAYPRGAYGVMSWWDYGHWITVEGERIPVANPFQQNARPASAFLLAESETRAELMVEALPSDSDAYTRSSAELESVVANQSDQEAHEDVRYVMIDDQMAAGKFYAIATWTGPPQSTYLQDRTYQYQGRNVTLPSTSERYDRTMLSRLYFGDAQGLAHYRLVHEVDEYSAVGGYANNNGAQALRLLSLRGNWTDVSQTAAQIDQAGRNGQLVPIGGGQFVYDAQVESRVKTYERVPGATLTGTVPEATNGTPVFALVTLETDAGRQFTYLRQTTTDADGSFSVTVSYATDNAVGPEAGGTNSSVRAVSDYAIRAGNPLFPSANGSATVPESAVYGGETIEVDVEPAAGDESNETAGAGDTNATANETTVEPAGEGGDGSASNATAGDDDTNATAGENDADSTSNQSAVEPVRPPSGSLLAPPARP